MPKKQTTATSTEIFKYAEAKHGIQWNPCNDLFFCTEVMKFHGCVSFSLEDSLPCEPLYETVEPDYEVTPEIIKNIMAFTTSNDEVCLLAKTDRSKLADVATLIIAQFAIENKLTEFLILST